MIEERTPDARDATPEAGLPTPALAVLCCSVGSTWTIELHEFDPETTLGTLVDWISSGVPTSQPRPDEEAVRLLLAERGLAFHPDTEAGPSTPSRWGIGYVYTAPLSRDRVAPDR